MELQLPLIETVGQLSRTEQFLLDGLIHNDLLWMPHPENVPQILAYTTEADIVYFGGAAGGGKSDLILGLAVTAHQKSIIFRREYKQLRELVDRSQEILAPTDAKYNQTFMRWRGIPGGRVLEFGAVQHEKDKENYKGRPHDLKAFDEIPDFTESQFRYLIAWNRSTDPNQRCRVVCSGNPPTSAEGDWVIRYWAPWLDEYHKNPAKPGELRWFASIDGVDEEFESGEPVAHRGETIRPMSRTFIPSFLGNNPYLANTTYEAVLQGLPEPLRSQLLFGLFNVHEGDAPRQVIPTEWIRAAQRRWVEREPPDQPLTRLGVDPSRGGKDTTELAPLTENYFHELKSYPGTGVPDSAACVALIIEALGEWVDADLNVDVIGIGSAVVDNLEANDYNVYPIGFNERSVETDKSGQLSFRNKRAEAYWKLREDLDPDTGRDLALPPDHELLADLAAPQWGMTVGGITIEPKKLIRKRLGRSPGKGDAVVLANLETTGGVYFR